MRGVSAVIAFDTNRARAQCSLIWWKSGNLRRKACKVSRTLAVEAPALNTALGGDLVWAKAIYTKFLDLAFFDLGSSKCVVQG